MTQPRDSKGRFIRKAQTMESTTEQVLLRDDNRELAIQTMIADFEALYDDDYTYEMTFKIPLSLFIALPDAIRETLIRADLHQYEVGRAYIDINITNYESGQRRYYSKVEKRRVNK